VVSHLKAKEALHTAPGAAHAAPARAYIPEVVA
jgi:hypothetical protein